MGITKAIFKLNNEQVSPPENIADFSIGVVYGIDNQASVTSESVMLVFDAYEKAMDWIEGGLTGKPGIFEGMPCELILEEDNESITGFSGCLDLRNAKIYPELKKMEATLVKSEDLNAFNERLESIDCALLLSEGFISASDYVRVPCVVERPGNGLDFIMLQVTTFILAKEIVEQSKQVPEKTKDFLSEASGGLWGWVGAGIGAGLEVALQVTYIGLMLKAVLDMVNDMFRILIPPRRIHSGIKLKTLLSATAKKLGYALDTAIPELEMLTYLPSNTNADVQGREGEIKTAGVIKSGIPNTGDYGFVCAELFALAKNLFNGSFKIEGKTLQFHNVNDPVWESSRKWEMPDAIKNRADISYTFNTSDIKSSKLLIFATDTTDEYTITNYAGTSAQKLIKPKTVLNERCVELTGYDRVDFNVCLGNRKDRLNPFEGVLRGLASIVDEVLNKFGGASNLAGRVRSRVGSLRVSSNNFVVPKLLWLSGGQLPTNHRRAFNAETLMTKYYNDPVDKQQKKRVENITVPFGMKDFIQVVSNAYFIALDPEHKGVKVTGKLLSVNWSFANNTAEISYEIAEIYTRNIKEEVITP